MSDFNNDERVTLARVEQQLHDSVSNQSRIIEDLRTIFGRIEKESKIIALIRSDLKSHLDSTPVRREEVNTRIKYIEERHTELKEAVNKFKEEIRKTISDDSKKEDKNDKVEIIEKDFLQFKTEIKTSLAVTRWIFGGLITLLGVLVTIFELSKNFKLGN